MEQIVNEKVGIETFMTKSKHIDYDNNKVLRLSTSSQIDVEIQPEEIFDTIINFKRINDLRYINKFFEVVNSKLPKGGIYISCAETSRYRKERILKKYPFVLNYAYYILDFIFKRIFPKLPVTKKIYFLLTGGRNRVISKTEYLGRLFSCGFEVVEEYRKDGLLYILAFKISKPVYDKNPTYGPLIRLKRIGKNGIIFNVYKFRTMHPYSEYLQEYVYKNNSLDKGGKFKNDLRISTLGHLLRKYWIDEFPMFINIFKGQMKLVGVRPLSKHYFSLYSKETQERRVKYKPGLIPPYYADMPNTLDEIEVSELNYMCAYDKHPFLTDVKYFFKAFYNILIKNARSK
ncbi:MAG: sugar transferase [Bacteroidetes bacterium]|nr:sugar transferase [Bacteroidota bacterium]